MATPKYNSITSKVRDWSNKPEANTIPESVIDSCLAYAADDCYRLLRIPPLEATVQYLIGATDNTDARYTKFPIPNDLTEFRFVKQDDVMFNEIADVRTFFDRYSEKYAGPIWIWKEESIHVQPQQTTGVTLDIGYYRRLPALTATYAVVTANYDLTLTDAFQPYLVVGNPSDIPMYFAGAGVDRQVFDNSAAATVYGLTQPITTVTTVYFQGQESPNWLRDENERLLIWGALHHLGAYLFDDIMEKRYEARFVNGVTSLNKEEKFRRASGGNVRMNFNGGGLI
jgi:hypothetical protein